MTDGLAQARAVSAGTQPGAIDPQEPSVVICSRECLRAFAANTPDPDRVASLSSRGRPRGGRATQPWN